MLSFIVDYLCKMMIILEICLIFSGYDTWYNRSVPAEHEVNIIIQISSPIMHLLFTAWFSRLTST